MSWLGITQICIIDLLTVLVSFQIQLGAILIYFYFLCLCATQETDRQKESVYAL